MASSESVEHLVMRILRRGAPLDVYTIAKIVFAPSGAPEEARPRRHELRRTGRALRALIGAGEVIKVGRLPLQGVASEPRPAYSVAVLSGLADGVTP